MRGTLTKLNSQTGWANDYRRHDQSPRDQATVDPVIDAATTPDELKAATPAALTESKENK